MTCVIYIYILYTTPTCIYTMACVNYIYIYILYTSPTYRHHTYTHTDIQLSSYTANSQHLHININYIYIRNVQTFQTAGHLAGVCVRVYV